MSPRTYAAYRERISATAVGAAAPAWNGAQHADSRAPEPQGQASLTRRAYAIERTAAVGELWSPR